MVTTVCHKDTLHFATHCIHMHPTIFVMNIAISRNGNNEFSFTTDKKRVLCEVRTEVICTSDERHSSTLATKMEN